MACVCWLFIDFIGLFCACCSFTFLSFFDVGVYMVFFCVLCCCLLFHWLVVRVCVGVVVLFSCLLFCYGLSAFTVYDCMLYVPYLRCYFLFV